MRSQEAWRQGEPKRRRRPWPNGFTTNPTRPNSARSKKARSAPSPAWPEREWARQPEAVHKEQARPTPQQPVRLRKMRWRTTGVILVTTPRWLLSCVLQATLRKKHKPSLWLPPHRIKMDAVQPQPKTLLWGSTGRRPVSMHWMESRIWSKFSSNSRSYLNKPLKYSNSWIP